MGSILKITDKIGLISHMSLSEKLFRKLEVTDLIDLGAGLNPQQDMREDLNIRQLLIDLNYPEEKKARVIRKQIDVLDFNSLINEVKDFNQSVGISETKIDAVVSIQNIEHLERKQGENLLDFLGVIARKIVIVETPNGFVFQAGTSENPFQEHLSGWTVQDFKSRGYKVRGTSGLKVLKKKSNKGEYRLNFKGMRFLDVLLSRILCIHYFPRACFNLYAYRIIK